MAKQKIKKQCLTLSEYRTLQFQIPRILPGSPYIFSFLAILIHYPCSFSNTHVTLSWCSASPIYTIIHHTDPLFNFTLTQLINFPCFTLCQRTLFRSTHHPLSYVNPESAAFLILKSTSSISCNIHHSGPHSGAICQSTPSYLRPLSPDNLCPTSLVHIVITAYLPSALCPDEVSPSNRLCKKSRGLSSLSLSNDMANICSSLATVAKMWSNSKWNVNSVCARSYIYPLTCVMRGLFHFCTEIKHCLEKRCGLKI